jgi:cell shape-determining protein MreC
VQQGQPVIDDLGVVGQVTRVFPFTAEVTLLSDKNQAIPVQILEMVCAVWRMDAASHPTLICA